MVELQSEQYFPIKMSRKIICISKLCVLGIIILIGFQNCGGFSAGSNLEIQVYSTNLSSEIPSSSSIPVGSAPGTPTASAAQAGSALAGGNSNTGNSSSSSSISNLIANTFSASQIDLSWTINSPSSGSEPRILVERSLNSAGPFANFPGDDGIVRTTFSDRNLSGSTTYYYRICAIIVWGAACEYSNVVSATTSQISPDTPNAPSGLTATSASGRVNLVWVDNSLNEEGFEVERGASPDGHFVLAGRIQAGVTTYTSNLFIGGSTLYYRIRSYNSSGYSAYTQVVQVTLVSSP